MNTTPSPFLIMPLAAYAWWERAGIFDGVRLQLGWVLALLMELCPITPPESLPSHGQLSGPHKVPGRWAAESLVSPISGEPEMGRDNVTSW